MSNSNARPETPDNNAAGSPPNAGRRDCKKSGWRRGRAVVIGAALLIGLAGFGAGRASSWHWGRGHGPGFGMNSTVDAETATRRADAGIARMLGSVDATPEQKSKISEIASGAIKDMFPSRDALKRSREKLAALLKADKLDRAAIEQLRAEQLALGETVSKRASQALADAAEVLTPAQRAKLVERWQERFQRS